MPIEHELRSIRLKSDSLRAECRRSKREGADLLLQMCVLIEELAAVLDTLAQRLDWIERKTTTRR